MKRVDAAGVDIFATASICVIIGESSANFYVYFVVIFRREEVREQSDSERWCCETS